MISPVISWLIGKIMPFRALFTIFSIVLKVAWIASLFVFFTYITVALTRLWGWFREMVGMLNGSALQGSMVGGNDVGSLIIGLLDSMGVSLVLETFVPLFISTASFYLTWSLAKVVLSFQRLLMTEFDRAVRLGLGGY